MCLPVVCDRVIYCVICLRYKSFNNRNSLKCVCSVLWLERFFSQSLWMLTENDFDGLQNHMSFIWSVSSDELLVIIKHKQLVWSRLLIFFLWTFMNLLSMLSIEWYLQEEKKQGLMYWLSPHIKIIILDIEPIILFPYLHLIL